MESEHTEKTCGMSSILATFLRRSGAGLPSPLRSRFRADLGLAFTGESPLSAVALAALLKNLRVSLGAVEPVDGWAGAKEGDWWQGLVVWLRVPWKAPSLRSPMLFSCWPPSPLSWQPIFHVSFTADDCGRLFPYFKVTKALAARGGSACWSPFPLFWGAMLCFLTCHLPTQKVQSQLSR